MPINFTSFEAKLQAKLDAITASSSETEMLLLSKTVEAAIANITITDIQDKGTIEVNAVNLAGTTHKDLVNAAGVTQKGLVDGAGATQVTAVNTAGNTYFPTMDAASAGKFLTNNGAAGVKSWAPINVNNITGNLDVAGNITSTGIVDGQRINGYPSNIGTGSPAGDVTRMAGRFSGSSGVGNGGAIAFDYGPVTTGFPACIGYAIEDNGGHTKGGIVFKTRDSTGINDLPTERMRIAANGDVTFNGQPVGSKGIFRGWENTHNQNTGTWQSVTFDRNGAEDYIDSEYASIQGGTAVRLAKPGHYLFHVKWMGMGTSGTFWHAQHTINGVQWHNSWHGHQYGSGTNWTDMTTGIIHYKTSSTNTDVGFNVYTAGTGANYAWHAGQNYSAMSIIYLGGI